jgi:hypothetical protein
VREAVVRSCSTLSTAVWVVAPRYAEQAPMNAPNFDGQSELQRSSLPIARSEHTSAMGRKSAKAQSGYSI